MADTVLVGEMESTRRVQEPDARAKTTPFDPVTYTQIYLCEVTVKVKAVIKDSASRNSVGNRTSFLWFLPSAVCRVDFVGHYTLSAGEDSLWLLRWGQGVLRTVVDNASASIPLHNLTPQIVSQLGQWRDQPQRAAMYLLLKPGVTLPERHFAVTSLSDTAPSLGSAIDFLVAYRTIYLESDMDTRGEIGLAVSRFGLCLGLARRTAQAEGLSDKWPFPYFLSEDGERRRNDTVLDEMPWSSREDLLAEFGTPENAVQHLTGLACVSAARVKARARELLSQYFKVDLSTLPCIPCE